MKKLLAPITIALGFLGVLLTGLVVSVNASNSVAPDDGNLLDLARPIFDAIMAGHYIAAAAAALVFSMALLKRYAPGKVGEFVHSNTGGSLTTLLMAMGGSLLTATMGGAPWEWGMLWAALMVGVVAMGGYTAIKRLIVRPLLIPLQKRLPVWAQPVLGMILWMFDSKFGGKDPVKEAEAAGEAAVATKPSDGANSVVGTPTDL